MFFFSLICAAILYVMWKNIADEHDHYKSQKRRKKISQRTLVLRQQPHLQTNAMSSKIFFLRKNRQIIKLISRKKSPFQALTPN